MINVMSLSRGKRGRDSRILSRHCGAQAFGDYAGGCQICYAVIIENELFSRERYANHILCGAG
jgi:hypothetical protein